MNRSLTGKIFLGAFTVLTSRLALAAVPDVEMKILKHPDYISRYSESYVRVRIINNGKEPLRGCDRSGEKCIAIAWDFVESPSEMTVPAKNIVALQPYFDSYLTSGEAIEKSVRILPAAAPTGSHVVLSLSLVLKEGPTIHLTEQRLKLAVKPPSRTILNRRTLVRSMVYGYLSLSAIGAFLLFRSKD